MRGTQAVITQERALDTLSRYKIAEDEVLVWETELGLDIPEDQFGNKVYSQLHVNLFKNIKKHLSLGRSLTEIRRMLVLPETSQPELKAPAPAKMSVPLPVASGQNLGVAIPQQEETLEDFTVKAKPNFKNTLGAEVLSDLTPPALPELNMEYTPPMTPIKQSSVSEDTTALKTLSTRTAKHLKRFASAPPRISKSMIKNQHGANSGLLLLVDNLMAEKDDLHAKLVLLEKQKTHLLQANDMFQTRVKDMTTEIDALQEQLKMQQNFKLMDDKSKLQKQLIDTELKIVETEKKQEGINAELDYLRASLANKIDPKVFLGSWMEEAELVEVSFDNFGINIESQRSRLFKITTPPQRLFGHTAVIETAYDYQANTLWKRTETLVLSIIQENRLEGELTAEYTLDGTPVARALYKIRCQRQGARQSFLPA